MVIAGVRCRRKAESVNIMKRRILHHESRKPTLQNLRDEHDRYPGSTAEESPVTMIGLQSVSENG